MNLIEKMKSKRDKVLTFILKKIYKFPENYQVSNFNYQIQKALPGKMFRKCITIYLPSSPPPYNKDNWDKKICAVVLFKLKFLSFVVTKPNHQ